MEQSVTPVPRHWKLFIFVIACLILSLTISAYLLIHNRNPQITMGQLAQQYSHQTIDKKVDVQFNS